MAVLVLPHQRVPGWDAGPPSQPLTRGGYQPPLHPTMSLADALRASHATDAHVQTCLPPGPPTYAPRVNRNALREAANHYHHHSVFVDTDLADHSTARWSCTREADEVLRSIIPQLSTLGMPPTFAYSTRGGARFGWELARPIPTRLWGRYRRLLEELRDGVDWGPLTGPDFQCCDPSRLFRLADVLRDGERQTPASYVFDGVRLLLDVTSEDEYDWGAPSRMSRITTRVIPKIVPPRVPQGDDRWAAARLGPFSTFEYVPTRDDPAPGAWQEGGAASASGYRDRVAWLAGRAVFFLAKRHDPETVPEMGWALLAPLVLGCRHQPGSDVCPEHCHDGSGLGLLWELLKVYAARENRIPAILQHPREDNYLVRKDLPSNTYDDTPPPPILCETKPAHLPALIREVQPRIPTTREGEKGEVALSAPAIFESHGRVITRRFYTYTEATDYDWGTGHLTVNATQPRDVRPEFNAQCAEWLGLAAGDDYDYLAESLAAHRILDRPWALLWLGPSPGGTGKKLIGDALAAFYAHSRPLNYRDVVMGNWNQALVQTPVVTLAEGLRKSAESVIFREFVAEGVHTIRAKYQADSTLIGNPRVVVTSNNDDPLKMGLEDLTEEDLDAVAQRITQVPFRRAGRDFLATIGNWDGTSDWITMPDGSPGRLVRHIAWLEETVTVDLTKRFLGQRVGGTFRQSPHHRQGLARNLILYALGAADTWNQPVRGLGRPTKSVLEPALLWCPDGLWVRHGPLRELWDVFAGEQRRPSVGALLNVLKSLQPKDRHTLVKWGSVRKRARLIPRDVLMDLAVDAGWEPSDLSSFLDSACDKLAQTGGKQ